MLKIGITQIKNSSIVEENFHSIIKSLNYFESTGVDIIMFPECSLSGFTGKVNECSKDQLNSYLSEIENWSKINEKYVVLPTAFIEGEKIFNTGFIFGECEAQQFYKLGLTDSEKTFFSTPNRKLNKVFRIRGYNLAILVCFEAQQDPWKYFNNGDVDIILWPGYWGWLKGESWQELKKDGEQNLIFENMKKWQRPLVQSNFAFNDLKAHSGAGPHGQSMFVNSNNKLFGKGEYDSESCYELHISNNEIQFCKKVADL